MSISRRFFLQMMGAAGVALALPNVPQALAPLLPPEVVPPTPVDPFGLRTIQITFPDGVKATLQGFIRSQFERDPIDGVRTTDFSFTPSGPMTMEEGAVGGVRRTRRHEAMAARETTLLLDGKEIGALTEITLPSMQRSMIEVTRDPRFTGGEEKREFIGGLRRMSDLTFTCEFHGECLI